MWWRLLREVGQSTLKQDPRRNRDGVTLIGDLRLRFAECVGERKVKLCGRDRHRAGCRLAGFFNTGNVARISENGSALMPLTAAPFNRHAGVPVTGVQGELHEGAAPLT